MTALPEAVAVQLRVPDLASTGHAHLLLTARCRSAERRCSVRINWLFDSRKLVRMHFDEDENFLGGEIIDDPAVIVQHNYWRDTAWHHVKRDDLATEQHPGPDTTARDPL